VDTTIDIDGSEGEGGGQVLRTALGLSIVTGRPFRIRTIRARRARPGLLRQHLAAVRIATVLGDAEVDGDVLGSSELSFRPRGFVGGDHHVQVGSAGSAMLVIQTVLPALLRGDTSTRITVEGGTHNPSAPPFDFVERAFLPQLTRMGARLRLTLERAGFYPAGGGRVVVEVDPAPLQALHLVERGPVRLRGRAVVSALPDSVARRELVVLAERLGLSREDLTCDVVRDPVGPGNVVLVEAVGESVTEVFTAFGTRGVRAEAVADAAATEALEWLERGVPVGEHLADQLLVPLALAGGRFRTGPLSSHALTNLAVIARFVDRAVRVSAGPGGVTDVIAD
jgi:RNA 3'-terminal phosphate cyclase (ATP)